MKTSKKTNKLNSRDFIFIGIFGAVALLIFFVTGALAALTLFGTVANIPITLFFISIAFMLLVSKVRKPGVFLSWVRLLCYQDLWQQMGLVLDFQF